MRAAQSAGDGQTRPQGAALPFAEIKPRQLGLLLVLAKVKRDSMQGNIEMKVGMGAQGRPSSSIDIPSRRLPPTRFKSVGDSGMAALDLFSRILVSHHGR